MKRARSDLEPSGFFALRTPLLPFEALDAFASGLSAADPADPRPLADRLATDSALLRARLRELALDPVVREALFCASPTLDAALDAWLADPASPRAKGVTSILVRYLYRMAGRATPFGLFSGCSVGAIGAETSLSVGPRAGYVRRTRLDMGYLCLLVDALEADPDVRASLRWEPTSGLYRSGGQLRYAEARTNPETRSRTYHLVSVDESHALTIALESARGGARRHEIAAAIVAADPEVSFEEASGFVDQLIDGKLLVSDLTPHVTGAPPIEPILGALARADLGSARAALETVHRNISSMDEDGLGIDVQRYGTIADDLSTLGAKVDLARLFQIDLHKPAPEARLGGAAVEAIVDGVELMRRIGRPLQKRALDAFREDFQRRWEDREVPLVDVLDDERGIPFGVTGGEPSPLLDGLPIPFPSGTPGLDFGKREAWTLRRYTELVAAGAREWALDDADIAAFTHEPPGRVPDAFAVIATFAAASPEALASGAFELSLSISLASGAQLLGRFCHGDPELCRRVRAHLQAEEEHQRDAVFAEIVHLPEGRLGNVLCRPVLREHEIPFLGRSGAPADKQIPVHDLLVSIDRGRVVLRSRSLGCEVIPRMSTAHNHGLSTLAIYRFLCSLVAQDDDRQLGWDWGPLGGAPFLPRVTRGRLVLSLAQWMVPKERVAELFQRKGADWFHAVQQLRRELAWPRWITVAQADNVMPIDLDNVLSVESLSGLLTKGDKAIVREMFPAPDRLCARGPEGRFCHEVVVPFVRRRNDAVADEARRARRVHNVAVERTFPPGSAWLFAKLHAGTATVDALLATVVAPVVREAIDSGHADAWFFLRYGDPDWHLRLRLHGSPNALLSRVLPTLHRAIDPWIADGRVHRVTLDTYEREVERYGGDLGIRFAESFFHADSDAALGILSAYSGDERADARWRLTLAGMHRLLDDLGVDLAKRVELLGKLRDTFAAETRGGSALDRAIGAKFRAGRVAVERLLDEAPPHPSLAPGFECLAARSKRLVPLFADLRARCESGEIDRTVDELAAAYLHMHANRMLAAEARVQELVLYDWLARLYESRVARAKRR